MNTGSNAAWTDTAAGVLGSLHGHLVGAGGLAAGCKRRRLGAGKGDQMIDK